jgi:hypothetical protein
MHGAERERVVGRLLTDSDNYPACRQAGITLDRLAKRGYESTLDYYLKVRPAQTFMGLSFTS